MKKEGVEDEDSCLDSDEEKVSILFDYQMKTQYDSIYF